MNKHFDITQADKVSTTFDNGVFRVRGIVGGGNVRVNIHPDNAEEFDAALAQASDWEFNAYGDSEWYTTDTAFGIEVTLFVPHAVKVRNAAQLEMGVS